MIQRDTCTILTTSRIFINTFCITIINRCTVIRLNITTTESQRVNRTYTYSAYFLHPISCTSKVVTCTRCQAISTILCSIKHIEVFLDNVESYCTIISCMKITVARSLLCCHEDNTIRTTCTIDSRSCTILEAFDIIWVNISKVTTWYTINNNQWTQACCAG